MTASGPDPRADLPEFLVPFASMHDAMRRDVERLAATDPAVDPQGLARWWRCFEAVIVGHHSAEDDIVWPAMAERLPDFAPTRDRLVEEHHALDRAMAEVRSVLDGAAAGEDVTSAWPPALAELRSVLDTHLAYEEESVFPRLEHDFPRDAYEAAEKEIQRRGSFREAAFELPWVLDEAGPRVRTVVDGLIPAPMRIVHRLLWERRYRRLVAPLRRGA